MTIKRGDILLVDFEGAKCSEQGGIRPALVIQNDIGNRYSPTTVVCPITSRDKKLLPTHMEIDTEESGLKMKSVVLFEQIRTIDKSRVIKKIGHCGDSLNESMYKCLEISFGMI